MSIRLVESFSMSEDLRKRVRQVKSDALTESFRKFAADKSLTEATAKNVVLWEMPISRYNFYNANGRMYSRALWERVINEQQDIWRGQVGLADHPKDTEDGNFKEAAVVWLDMRLDEEGLVWGTCAFVGQYGALAEDILSKGGRIGFSSSGLGDLLENGEVDPNTFVIERPADIVLNPSQNVFGKMENLKKDSAHISNESRKTESSVSNLQYKGKETMEQVKLAALEEKRVRRDIMNFLEDASKIEDPQAKLEEMEEIKSFIDAGIAVDLKEAVDKKIEEQRKIINDLIKDAKELKETFKVKNTSEDIKDGMSLLAAEVKVAMSEAKDWERIANTLSESVKRLKAKLAVSPTSNYVESLAKKIKSLRMLIKSKDAQLSEMRKSAHKIVREDKQQISEKDERIKNLLAEKKNLLEKNQRLNRRIKFLNKVIAEKNALLNAKDVELEHKFKAYKEATTPVLIPTAKDRLSDILNINEKNDIERYFADLISRHGKSILPYKSRFLRCRSLKEATNIYIKILPTLNEGEDYYESLSLPDGSGIGITERRQLQEEMGFVEDQSSRFANLLKRNGLR